MTQPPIAFAQPGDADHEHLRSHAVERGLLANGTRGGEGDGARDLRTAAKRGIFRKAKVSLPVGSQR